MSCFIYVCGGRTHIQVHRAGVKHTEPPPGPGSGARQELCSGLFCKGRWVSAFSIPAGGGRAATSHHRPSDNTSRGSCPSTSAETSTLLASALRTNQVKKSQFYKICRTTTTTKKNENKQKNKSQKWLPLYSQYSILLLGHLTKAKVPKDGRGKGLSKVELQLSRWAYQRQRLLLARAPSSPRQAPCAFILCAVPKLESV